MLSVCGSDFQPSRGRVGADRGALTTCLASASPLASNPMRCRIQIETCQSLRSLVRAVGVLILWSLAAFSIPAVQADSVDDAINRIAQVGPLGQGSADARSACDELSRR